MNTILREAIERKNWSQIAFAALAIIAGGVGGMLVVQSPDPTMIIAAVLGIAVSLSMLFQPTWGLYMLVLIVYSNLSDVLKSTYGAPSIAQPFIVLILLTILLRWVLFHEVPKGWVVPALLLGLYGLVTFSSLLYARSFSSAQSGVISFWKDVIITVIMCIMIARRGTLRGVIWTIIGVGLFLGAISVYQYTTGTYDNNYWGFARPPVVDTASGSTTFRLAGPIGDPNFFAQMILVSLPLALDRLWNARSLLLRVIAGSALTCVALTILFTFSRGAFLSMIVVLAIMILRRGLNPMALLFTPLVVVLVVQFAPPSYLDRVATVLQIVPSQQDSGVVDQSFRGRSSEMMAAWMMFQDYPVLGVGMGNYNVYYLDYSRLLGIDQRGVDRSAHSLYLEIAAERGLMGLLTFIVVVGLVFRQMAQAAGSFGRLGLDDDREIVIALGVSLIGYLLAAIVLHDAYPRTFWMLVGICLATAQVARHEVELRRAAALTDTAALTSGA